jgi:O-antigen ligase
MVVGPLTAVSSIVWVWLCVRHPAHAGVVVVGFAVCWSHVLALLLSASGETVVVRGLIPVKDAAAVLLLLVLLVRARRCRQALHGLPFVALLLLLSLLPAVVRALTEPGFVDAGLSLRNAVVPFLAGATALLLRRDERRVALRGSILLVSVAAAYALVEYLLPVSFVRDVIGVGTYWSNVKEQSFLLDPRGSGLPGNFFTSSGTRRLSGSFGDPLSAGYVLAVVVVLVVLSRRSRATWFVLAVTIPALLLTLTRAGWIIAACALAPTAIRAFMTAGARGRAAIVAAPFVAIALVFLLQPSRTYLRNIFSGRDGSTLGHIDALAAWDNHDYSIWGSGLGTVGAAIGTGTESVALTIGLQIGLLGLVFYLAALVVIAIQGSRRWGRSGFSREYVGACIGVAVSMVLSEQLLTFNAGWPLCFLLLLSPVTSRCEDDGSGLIEGRENLAQSRRDRSGSDARLRCSE